MNVPYLIDIYGHYGYDPYWEPGYRYPMFPYFPYWSTPTTPRRLNM